ncbi:hypothetical protein CFIO01_12357 [Colletotrichum fioriniae PJ7]|uniref:BTB domain-containing protein n=1 Tax=Colletotrichum fioriniae PJ7 TaxID=1445577 RepID=A0A010S498_9PEZI|nr:hypothetical protein CFIO01_12357 [Colletotrichum fioriniae PJ7]
MVDNTQPTGMETQTDYGQHQVHGVQPLGGVPQVPDVQHSPQLGAPGSLEHFTGQSETICPDGDLYVILVDSRNIMLAGFRVSSQICRVASTAFAKWIDAAFSAQDGCKVFCMFLSPGSSAIDGQALRCILSIMHHTNIDQYKKLDVEKLLRVSETNLVLKCNNALAPRIGIWCQKILQTITEKGQPSVVGLGMLLKSADNFEAKDELVKLRQYAIRNLPIPFQQIWAQNPPLMTLHKCESLGKSKEAVLSLVPDIFSPFLRFLRHGNSEATNGLQVDVENRLVRAFSHIGSFKGLLDTRSEGYLTARRLCLSCGRRHPSNAKVCHLCRNVTLYDDVCTKNSRVGEYFELLALQTLWPVDVWGQEDSTLWTISQRVKKLTSETLHNCSGGSKCPLIVHLNALQGHLKRIMDDCARSNTSGTQERYENVTIPDIRKVSMVEGGGAIAEVVIEDHNED